MSLDSKIPAGPLEQKWSSHKMNSKLINPANKRKFNIIVVGSGLAGGAAAATLSELGYNVNGSGTKDRRAAPTPSPRKAASTHRKITATTATPFTAFSTTPSRAAISAPVRPTSIASPRFPAVSSTNASPKACLSPANMVGC